MALINATNITKDNLQTTDDSFEGLSTTSVPQEDLNVTEISVGDKVIGIVSVPQEDLNVTEISVGDKVIGIASVPVKGQEGIAPPFYKGEKGEKGDKGDKGDVGNSAYEDWVANGGVGTFQDFLDEIVEPVNLLIPQTLTEGQKAQVRENINVLSYAVMSEAEFAALPVKNEDVLYLIIEE